MTSGFARLARRAAKLGVPAPTYTLIGDVFEIREESRVRLFQKVQVNGAPVRLGDWRIIAAIEHLRDDAGVDMNILYSAPGESCPMHYRDAPPRCDHCNTTRRRNDTYVVGHADGRILQVGRNCLKDFTGHDAHEALAGIGLYGAAGDMLDDFCAGGSRMPDAYDLTTFMTMTACVVRTYGWR